MNVRLRMLFLGLSIYAATSVAQATNQEPMPVTDHDYYPASSSAKVELGKALFYDKILSDNNNISCATCHHSLTGTGDGLALPVGEGGKGLGVTRDTGSGIDAIHERVPRNAPHIFNLGAREFVFMFHDGRVGVDNSQPSGFSSPAGDQLPLGLDNPLAVQAMFPVTSATEMAGQAGENPVADAAAIGNLAGENGVWDLLAQRLRSIPEYVALFQDAYPGQINTADDIQFKDAAMPSPHLKPQPGVPITAVLTCICAAIMMR